MSINAMQLPSVSNANNEQATDIWVAVGKSTDRTRYPLIHKVLQPAGLSRGRMRFAFKPLAFDMGLGEEVPIVGCINFGGLMTHMPLSYLSWENMPMHRPDASLAHYCGRDCNIG